MKHINERNNSSGERNNSSGERHNSSSERNNLSGERDNSSGERDNSSGEWNHSFSAQRKLTRNNFLSVSEWLKYCADWILLFIFAVALEFKVNLFFFPNIPIDSNQLMADGNPNKCVICHQDTDMATINYYSPNHVYLKVKKYFLVKAFWLSSKSIATLIW